MVREQLFDGLGNLVKPTEYKDLEDEIVQLNQIIRDHKQLIDDVEQAIIKVRHEKQALIVQHRQAITPLKVKITKLEKRVEHWKHRFNETKKKVERTANINKELLIKIKALEHEMEYLYLKKKREEVNI